MQIGTNLFTISIACFLHAQSEYMNPAQGDNPVSTIPTVPSVASMSSMPPPPPAAPQIPPKMIDTSPTIASPGRKHTGRRLLFLIPIILLLGTMIIVSVVVLPALRKTPVATVVETPSPTLVPATPIPTAKPDPTLGWKEYVNRDAMVSFRYPPSMSLKEQKTSLTQYSLTLSDDASASATVMRIVSAKNTTGVDLLKSQGEADPTIKTSETEIDVSGVSSKKTLSVQVSDPTKPILYTVVEQDTNAYTFVWYMPSVKEDTYNQILKTVRFVSPGITADWQTYTNTLGNYSLRFPPAWTLNTSDSKASASAQTVSIRKIPSEAQFQNLVIQTTVASGKQKVELSASEIVTSIQNLAGWKETPTLDFRTIGGAQAEVLSGEKDGSWYVYAVMWYRNILVEMSWRDTALRQEQDSFNDMLGSMKFK